MAACNTAEVTDVAETGAGKSAGCVLNIGRPGPRQLGFGLIQSLTEIQGVDSRDLAASPPLLNISSNLSLSRKHTVSKITQIFENSLVCFSKIQTTMYLWKNSFCCIRSIPRKHTAKVRQILHRANPETTGEVRVAWLLHGNKDCFPLLFHHSTFSVQNCTEAAQKTEMWLIHLTKLQYTVFLPFNSTTNLFPSRIYRQKVQG